MNNNNPRPSPSPLPHPGQAGPAVPAARLPVRALGAGLRWRAVRRILRRLTPGRTALDRLPMESLARLLERRQAELRAQVDAAELLRAVAAGHGALVATRHAVAFTVDHGPDWGVELKHLYVASASRRRGAGRALVARLRARHAGRNLFTRFDGQGRARFARLAGFSPAPEGQGWWQTDAMPLPPARGRLPAWALPLGCPPAPDAGPADEEHQRAARGVCASAEAAEAVLSSAQV